MYKLAILLLFWVNISYADTVKELEAYLGIVNISYAEIQSEVEGPNTKEAASGTASIISSHLAYHFHKTNKWSFYLAGTFPMLTSQGVGYFSLGTGGEYYLNPVPHFIVAESYDIKLKLRPTTRYFLHVETNINYLTYTTESAKKSDVSFGIGGGGGASYTLSDDWALKGKLSVTKDIGVITDSIAMKIFFGGIYFLNL